MTFPSITVCNQNQVEASFLRDLNIHGNTGKVNLLFDEFIHGHDRNLSKEEEEFLDNVLLNISVGHDPLIPPSFLQKSSQSCKDLFISTDFRQMNLTSTRIPDGSYYQLQSLGPTTFSTDFGSCCTFVPGRNLKPMSEKTFEDIYHTLESKALLGQANGINFLLKVCHYRL